MMQGDNGARPEAIKRGIKRPKAKSNSHAEMQLNSMSDVAG